jgi:GTP-binding protein HflX
MVDAVEDVLEEIGAGGVPRQLALNKADLVGDERGRELRFRHPGALLVSGVTGEGLDALGRHVEESFTRTLKPVDLLVPYEEGGRLAELHDIAGDLEREDTAEGVRVSARVPPTVAARFERFAANGRT